MRTFEMVEDLKVGSIVEVTGTAIKVRLAGDLNELVRVYGGRVYPVGQIASVVKVHFGKRILFAYVRTLRMSNDEEQGNLPALAPVAPDQRIMEADLFGEGTWDVDGQRLDFLRGVTTYPLPLQSVYLMTQDEVRELYTAAEAGRDEGEDPLVPLGTYVGADDARARANINRMFGQHCAVLGSTGAGKSAAVAAIIHGLLRQRSSAGEEWRPRVVIIDPHGEYVRAFGERAVVYRAYDAAAPEGVPGTLLKLPYWLMSGDEFRTLVIGKTEEEATSQNNIVYKALAHARMAELGLIETAKSWLSEKDSEAEPDEPRPANGHTSEEVAAFDRDVPVPFRLEEFIRHIENEQGVTWSSTGGGAWKKKSTSDMRSHRSILDKLNVLRADPRLRFLMAEYGAGAPNLTEVIEQFVGDLGDKRDIRVVDISGLPNEVAGPLTAMISRLLFEYKVWQTRAERERDPVVLVFEEAHRYVPNRGQAEYEAAQQAVRRVAREGRKYGLGILLVSQRPSDVESTVLSQCSSWIILRLTNSSDQELVGRFLPDSLAGMVRLLPSLVRREAIFVGEAAAIPARIRINHLSPAELPNSNDIKFADGWSRAPVEREAVGAVVARWTRGHVPSGPPVALDGNAVQAGDGTNTPYAAPGV